MHARKDALVAGQVYHIYTRSIDEKVIFSGDNEYDRMVQAIRYYRVKTPEIKFSRFAALRPVIKKALAEDTADADRRLVDIVCYCLMPTHLHLILKQLDDSGISVFMRNILDSYSRYYNIKHERKGPLWEGRFKNVRVRTDEQLLHLTRYIHLNPVTAYLVEKPEDWPVSSYREYLGECPEKDCICEFEGLLRIDAGRYRRFVEERIDEQRELARLKGLMLEKPLFHLRGGKKLDKK